MGELIKSKTFDLNKTSEYKLSIQVSLDGFSFFIFSYPENRLVAYKHDKLKISSESFIDRRFSEWLESEECMNKKFNRVHAFYITPKFTLVPEDFFEETKKREIVNLVFPPSPNELIEMNHLETMSGHKLLFAVQRKWKEVITEKFDGQIKHPVSVLTKKIMNSAEGESSSLALFFHANTFFAVLVKNNNLLFSNSFQFLHVNDVVYYLLSALKQLETEPKETQLFVAGEINRDDEISTQLKKYFPHFDYFSTEGTLQIDNDIFTFQTHQHISLLDE